MIYIGTKHFWCKGTRFAEFERSFKEKWHVWKGDATCHTHFYRKFGYIIRQAIYIYIYIYIYSTNVISRRVRVTIHAVTKQYV